jgi:arginyl-tRNA--protein-N-Asp/Glu arginylyltransferase
MMYEFYARIDLSKTLYSPSIVDLRLLKNPDPNVIMSLYKSYCDYKKFVSVMPMFPEEFVEPSKDVLGYYDNDKLVAFSLMHRFNNKHVEAIQFAWNYHKPKMSLGIESLKAECAHYKARGFDYIYLGEAHDYKKQIDGFEILGPL